MRNYLVFDVGTTAMKCILFDELFGEKICINREYDLITTENGFVEMEPMTYLNTFCECMKQIFDYGIRSEDIVSVTFTTQGETFIPIDIQGKPLRRAIVWLDSRAEQEAEYIKQNISLEEIYQTTGLNCIDGALPIAKILWIYRNEPGIYRNTYKFLLLEDFFVYCLTGRTVSEKSLSSSTGWYDIFSEELYQKIFSVCKLDAKKFPEILPCGTVVGSVTPVAAKQFGLSEKTVVVTGAMDQIASAIGAGNIREGVVTETTGTALVVGATVKKPILNQEQSITVYKHYNEQFIYMPYCNTAGIVQKWFKDTLLPQLEEQGRREGISPYEIMENIAKQSPPGSCGVLLFPHFAGKGEPDSIPDAKGAMIGFQLNTRIEDLVRSVLEGVAYMLREILEMKVFRELEIQEVCALGGGSMSKLWNQIKADVCKKKITTVGYAQTTALGAAVLGAVAVGDFRSVEDAVETYQYQRQEFLPDAENESIYYESFCKYQKLCKVLKDVYQ